MLKPASLAELKAELKTLPQEELLALCLRLARFKHDNKELLDYLLFAAHDVPAFAEQVKAAMTEEFGTVNTTSIWYAKKTIRKILRQANKYVRYAADKEFEVAVHTHFIQCLQQLPTHITEAAIIDKMLRSQEQKVRKLIRSLHPDLQHDYLRALQQATGAA